MHCFSSIMVYQLSSIIYNFGFAVYAMYCVLEHVQTSIYCDITKGLLVYPMDIGLKTTTGCVVLSVSCLCLSHRGVKTVVHTVVYIHILVLFMWQEFFNVLKANIKTFTILPLWNCFPDIILTILCPLSELAADFWCLVVSLKLSCFFFEFHWTPWVFGVE